MRKDSKSSGKIYGYARATTPKQKTGTQSDRIRKIYPDALIYEDSYSGLRHEHPSWDRMGEKLLPGDQIILCDITKLSDDPKRCTEIYADLFRQGIQIRILDDPLLDSEVYSKALTSSTGSSDSLMLVAASQIRLSHALKIERAQKTGDRIRDSLKRSQANGNHIGRPQRVNTYADSKKAIASKKKIWELSKYFQGTLSDPELIARLGIARNTFYKYKKHLSLYGLDDNRRNRK